MEGSGGEFPRTRIDTSYTCEVEVASSRQPGAILPRVGLLLEVNNMRYMIAFSKCFKETEAADFSKSQKSGIRRFKEIQYSTITFM